MWLTKQGKILFRPVKRDYEITPEDLLSNAEVTFDAWNYLTVRYNYATGDAAVVLDGQVAEEKNIGQRSLATQGVLNVGGVGQDDRRYVGEMACLQIYDKALTDAEIEENAACPVGEEIILNSLIFVVLIQIKEYQYFGAEMNVKKTVLSV